MTSNDSPNPLSSSATTGAETLTRWHEAVNAGDIDAVVALCTDDVALRGPRGVGQGHQLVRDWLTRSGIRLEPLEPLVEAEARFVVRERARRTTAASEPKDTWCVFQLRDGLVSSIARYDDESETPSA